MDSAASESIPANTASAGIAVAAAGARGFPLPLTEFEEYMLCDDRPSHPMVIVMLADVSGELRQAEFRASVLAMMQRQPLLSCRVETRREGTVWVPLNELHDPVIWTAVSDGLLNTCVPAVQPLDIRAGQGLRVCVWSSPVASRISFELHHACADGIAAVQLLNELFAEYASRTGGPPMSPAQSASAAVQALARRSPLTTAQPGTTAAAGRSTPLPALLGKLSRLLGRRPVRIADSQQRQRAGLTSPTQLPPGNFRTDESRRCPAILVRSLPEDSVRQLRAVASAHAVGLNDLLLLQMFTHVTAWNAQARREAAGHWVRIAVPVSMRDPRSGPLPACNLVSYALVTHRMRDICEPQQLLQQIHSKTLSMRSGRDGMIALKIFGLLRRIPCGVRAFLSLWPCAGTLVLANVGNVIRRCHIRLPLNQNRWVAGNITVERICGVPPVRPDTLVAVGLTEYAGQLHISLRTDGSRLTVEDSEAFLEQFVAGLERQTLR